MSVQTVGATAPRPHPLSYGRRGAATDRAVRARLVPVTVLACVAGCVLHGPVTLLRHCHPLPGVTPPMLMLVTAMFIGGFEVRLADLARALLRPGLLLAGLGVALVLRMVVLLGAERAAYCWPEQHQALWLVVGLSLTATMPVAGAAQTWGAKASADASLSLGLVLATTLLSPFTVPLGLALAEEPETPGPRAVLDSLAQADGTCRFMLLWVAAPCVAGLTARRLTGRVRDGRPRARALPWVRLSGLLNALGLTALNAAGVFGEIELKPNPALVTLALLGPLLRILPGARRRASRLDAPAKRPSTTQYEDASPARPAGRPTPHADPTRSVREALAGATVCAAPFAVGWCAWFAARRAHPGPGEAAALTLATGMNNTSAAAALAGSQFGGHPAVLLPIFFYGMAQQLLAAAVPTMLRRRTA